MATRRSRIIQGRKLGKVTKIKNMYADERRKPKNQKKNKKGGRVYV